eukprot:6209244-Pleurochrysis_carterae.AAC.4
MRKVVETHEAEPFGIDALTRGVVNMQKIRRSLNIACARLLISLAIRTPGMAPMPREQSGAAPLSQKGARPCRGAGRQATRWHAANSGQTSARLCLHVAEASSSHVLGSQPQEWANGLELNLNAMQHTMIYVAKCGRGTV